LGKGKEGRERDRWKKEKVGRATEKVMGEKRGRNMRGERRLKRREGECRMDERGGMGQKGRRGEGEKRGKDSELELSRDIYNRRQTHNSCNSAGRRYMQDTATTSTLVLEELGLEVALE